MVEEKLITMTNTSIRAVFGYGFAVINAINVITFLALVYRYIWFGVETIPADRMSWSIALVLGTAFLTLIVLMIVWDATKPSRY